MAMLHFGESRRSVSSPQIENLFQWARSGNFEAMRLAFERGVPVNVIEPSSTDSPLMIACRNGNTNIVKLCLEFGARNDPHPEFGQTALHAAVSSQQYQAAAALLEVAAASEADGMICNLTDSDGQSPLHLAARHGSTLLAQLLLSHGASISSVDIHGQTALHLCSAVGGAICLSMLLDHGGDGLIDSVDLAGNTPLHHATFNGNIECVRLLLETAADVTAKNRLGQMSYHIAASKGFHDIGHLLLEYTEISKSMSAKSNGGWNHSIGPKAARIPQQPTLTTRSHSDPHDGYSPSTRLNTTPRGIRTRNLSLSAPKTLTELQNYGGVSSDSYTNNRALYSSPSIPVKTRTSSVDSYLPSGLNMNLPRPHTVSSPASQQGSKRPTSAKLFSVKDEPISLAHASILNNYQRQLRAQGNGSPVNSSLSENSSLEEGGPVNGYKVLAKQSPVVTPGKPKFGRESSDRTASPMTSADCSPGEIALLDGAGVPTFTKHRIIARESPATPITTNNDHSSRLTKERSNNPLSSSWDSALLGFNSQDKIKSTPMSQTTHFQSNWLTDHQDYVRNKQFEAISSTPQVTGLRLSEDTVQSKHDESISYSSSGSPPKKSPSKGGGYPSNPYADATEDEDFAAPLETFTEGGRDWQVYMTETQDVYYLDISNEHSQWEDPRVYGLVFMEEDNTEAELNGFMTEASPKSSESVSTITPRRMDRSPPKSPSPKAVEKYFAFSPSQKDYPASIAEGKTEEDSVTMSPGRGKNQGDNSADNVFTTPERTFSVSAQEFFTEPPEVQLDLKSNKKHPSFRKSSEDLEVEKYLRLFKEGCTVKQMVGILRKENKSQDFILKVLEMSDDAITATRQSVPVKRSYSDNELVKSPRKDTDQDKGGPETEFDDIPIAEETEVSESLIPIESIITTETDLSRYTQMITLGINAGNVLQKMKLDGISERRMLEFLKNHKIDPSDYKDILRIDNPIFDLKTRNKSIKTLHWNTLPEERLKNSIWARTGDHGGDLGQTLIAETELAELTHLFSSEPKQDSNNTNSDRKAKILHYLKREPIPLKVLEKRRAQNITIGLVPLKPFGPHLNFMKAVCSLDSMNGIITGDHLHNFSSLLPTPSEMKRMGDITGSKHPAELFLQTALMFYPELPRRLHSFTICLQFPDHCESFSSKANLIIVACDKVLKSSHIARLLKKMLAVGNVMNQGTLKGEASGFTLDSLLKLVHTRGVDKKTTVLDYVVKNLLEKGENTVLRVIEDLQCVEDCAKLSSVDVEKEFNNLSENLISLEEEYIRNKKQQEEEGQLPFTSPIARTMVKDFSKKLNSYLKSYRSKTRDLKEVLLTLKAMTQNLVEYFGEPVDSEINNIFKVLLEFRSALEFSFKTMEWRLQRNQTA